MRKVISTIILVTLLTVTTFPIVASGSQETKRNIEWELLDTVADPRVDINIETRKERHERLIEEGYELVELKQVQNKLARNLYITGPDGLLYETRVTTSTYRQPNETEIKYGEDYLNIITQSTIGKVIDTVLGFVPKVGWVPSVLGINTTSLADFLSRGRVTHIADSTLFFYDIEVKPAGTNRYYFVASSERFEMAVTAISSGFTQLGTPVQETVSGFGASQSANYGKESALSNIAVDYFVTGGPNYTYVYFEHYSPLTYIRLD